MRTAPDPLHEHLAAKVRTKIEALERADCPLSLTEMAERLLFLAPDLYGGRPLSPTPSMAVPGTAAKLAVMGRRIACAYAPTHPHDLHLTQVNERRAMLPTDAGNGKPRCVEIVTEWADTDWTDDDTEDQREPLADRVRRWLKEDQAIRERWKLERDADQHLSLKGTS